MFNLFNRTPDNANAGVASSTTVPASLGGVAHQLLERAEAGAGRDPYRAQELRDAARAYLRVVR